MKISFSLAAFAALGAVASAAPYLFNTDENLPLVSSRKASSSDIPGEWILVEDGTPEKVCSNNITHTSWTRVDGTAKVIHNTMIVDGMRCDSLGLASGGKALTFYRSADYDNDLQPIGDAAPLPAALVEMLGGSGPNIATLAANIRYGEDFLIGYEDRNRVCGGKTVLPDRSTVFISRPFNGPLYVNNFETKLEVGSRWMVVVPRYLVGACLYEQKVPEMDMGDGLMPSGEPLESSPEAMEVMPTTPTTTVPDSAVPEEPEDSPEGSSEDDGEPACFPARATVQLYDGSVITMRDLSVGDRVQVGNGVFSSVYAFSHRDSQVTTRFVTIDTEAGRQLIVTPGHYVYANGNAVAAGQVKVGDRLVLADGGDTLVKAVSVAMDTGLYNPQTLQGDIVVNGVLASTYTTAVEAKVAEAMLAPFRALFQATGVDALFGYLESGAPTVASFLPSGATLA